MVAMSIVTARAPSAEYIAESNTARILAVVTVLHVLALLFICLRIYTRVFLVRAPGRDDYVMIISGICTLGGWIVFVFQSFYGLGRHNDIVSAPDLAKFNQAGFWQSVISASAALGLLKISIALSLLRLDKRPWYAWTLWALIAIISSYSFMGMMTFFLHCFPMEFHWDKTIKGGWCYDISLFVTFSLVNTSFNIATDVICATLPIPVIWNLQMKLRARLYIIGILSLGYMAVAMGVVKAVYQIAFSTEKDKTFTQNIQFWGFLQLQLGIIAACAPTLKPLFSKVLGFSSNKPSRLYDDEHSRRTDKGNVTIGAKSVRRTQPDYEMDDRSATSDEIYHTKKDQKNEDYAGGGVFYKAGPGDRSVSEEMILQGVDSNFKGIMRTTQVTVQ